MRAYQLYYGEQGQRKFSLLLKKNEDRILSLLPPSISSSLTRFFLGERDAKERALLEDLELIKDERVTPRGERILSSYPLFGSGKEKKEPYSTEFFPFLFSIISSSSVPDKYERYFASDDYLSLFPWRDKEECTRSSVYAVSALISLGVIYSTSPFLSLNQEKAISFMEADELSRLSYLFFLPDTKALNGGKKLLFIISRFNGLGEEEMEERMKEAERITSVSLPLPLLTTFGILKKKGELWSGAEIERENSSYSFVGTDMVLSYRGSTKSQLWRIAEPLKADTVSQWIITKKSIKNALDSGLSGESILRELENFSSLPVPDSVSQRISMWAEEYSRIKIKRVIMMEAERRSAKVIAALPQTKELILAHPNETLFIIEEKNERKWREALINAGFDMLEKERGRERKDEENNTTFPSLIPLPFLPDEREVPFNEKEYRKVLANAKGRIMKALVSSHLVFSSRNTLAFSWVDGLDYTLKVEMAEKAIANKDKLGIRWAKGEEEIVEPISLKRTKDKTVLEAKEKSLDFGKIWMLTILPSYIKEGD